LIFDLYFRSAVCPCEKKGRANQKSKSKNQRGEILRRRGGTDDPCSKIEYAVAEVSLRRHL
jgi:hypothetical protein